MYALNIFGHLTDYFDYVRKVGLTKAKFDGSIGFVADERQGS
jgi:hypothetical protein